MYFKKLSGIVTGSAHKRTLCYLTEFLTTSTTFLKSMGYKSVVNMLSLTECCCFSFLLCSGVGVQGGDGYSMTYHIFFDCYRIPSHRGTVERCCSTFRSFRNWWWFHWIRVQDQVCQDYTHACWAPCRTGRMRWSIQVFKKEILPHCLTNNILRLIHM